MKIRCCLTLALAGRRASLARAGGRNAWLDRWHDPVCHAGEGTLRPCGKSARTCDRMIQHSSHSGWDFGGRDGAESHSKWDRYSMVLSSCRMSRGESPQKGDSCRRIGATSHPAWDVCRMILSFDGTAGAKSHFKWDVCRIVLPSSAMSGATSPEKWDSCRISGATSPRGWDAAIFIPESRPRVRWRSRSRAPEAWPGGHDNPVMKSFP